MTPRWGRWGPDDEVGAPNLIGPAEVRAAVGLVSAGRVIKLGMDLGPATVVPPHRKRIERSMSRDGGDYAAGARRPGGFQFAEEVWSFAAHSGTHIDALSHAWYDDQLYNGFPGNGTRSTTGAQRCGAEKLAPLVTRGVLIDAAPGSSLPASTPVTADDLRASGVALRPGDVVLIRTGWVTAMLSDPLGYCDHEPGIDTSAAEWLAEADVAAVGADNYAVEVQPAPPGEMFPVHQLLLRDCGIPLIENLLLDELAAAGAAEFCFVAAPLPLVGGTAGPVCPLALL
ncbi:MAG TPA: cyclase family protein [Sporichthya sp.]|nr:cyclase family protein [Sporichthya sp.]